MAGIILRVCTFVRVPTTNIAARAAIMPYENQGVVLESDHANLTQQNRWCLHNDRGHCLPDFQKQAACRDTATNAEDNSKYVDKWRGRAEKYA